MIKGLLSLISKNTPSRYVSLFGPGELSASRRFHPTSTFATTYANRLHLIPSIALGASEISAP
jgi:hypothetical protein